ncbi:RDD family protein [Streptomyces sp. AC512_CC834]|uniref:RDD family protein n=1 Tax=Streptomyces sp. AC512_CC834 TaxID=2823691 RepID=UPI001C27432C|nr:RDD family protein [Streptomyces sp. AC512_CC834]
MSAPTPAPGDDRPREGYYPDPSIPGYVRYWNGASWVAGTSRPAPEDGEPLAPPPGARPSVEETGPHFFDEDPVGEPPGAASQHGSRPEPATAWGADRSHQPGHPGTPEQRVAWPGTAQGTDPRIPHARQPGPTAPPDPGTAPGGDPRAGIAGPGTGASTAGEGRAPGGPAGPAGPAGGGRPAQDGRNPGGSARAASADSAGSAASAGPAGSAGAAGSAGGGGPVQDGRGPGRHPGVPAGAASADSAGPAGSAGGGRPAQDDAASGAATSGEAEAQAGNTFVFRRPTAGPQSAPAAEDEGTMTFRAVTPRAGTQPGGSGSGPGPGFGAGKAAADRAVGAQPPTAPAAPGVPHQGQAPAPVPASQPDASAPVAAAGPGGGQSSWAQQVHRLAGADEQPVAPWKPPVDDVFQAAARRQAAARPAGLGKRLAARLIDTVVLAGVTGVAAVPLGVKAADHVNDKIDQAKLSGETVTVWLLDGTTSTYLGIVLAVLLLFGVVYEALPTAKWGRTLGKRLLGLEVRDIEAHEPPSFSSALRRWLVYSVPGLLAVGVVGVAWCLFDRPWHQCWHDKAARTFVAG